MTLSDTSLYDQREVTPSLGSDTTVVKDGLDSESDASCQCHKGSSNKIHGESRA